MKYLSMKILKGNKNYFVQTWASSESKVREGAVWQFSAAGVAADP